jgi:hypothetical protein
VHRSLPETVHILQLCRGGPIHSSISHRCRRGENPRGIWRENTDRTIGKKLQHKRGPGTTNARSRHAGRF